MNKQIYNFFMGVAISTIYVGTVGLYCKTSEHLKSFNVQKFK